MNRIGRQYPADRHGVQLEYRTDAASVSPRRELVEPNRGRSSLPGSYRDVGPEPV